MVAGEPGRTDDRVRYLDHVAGRGRDLYAEVCRRDLEREVRIDSA